MSEKAKLVDATGGPDSYKKRKKSKLLLHILEHSSCLQASSFISSKKNTSKIDIIIDEHRIEHRASKLVHKKFRAI